MLVYLLCALWGQARAANGVNYEYRRAESCVERLLHSPRKQKYRHHWLACINKFKAVYTAQPNGSMADDAIFKVGQLYWGLYRHSFSKKDKQEALDYYNRLVKRFPKSPYRSRALRAIAKLEGRSRGNFTSAAKRPVPVKKGVAKSNVLREIERKSSKIKKEETAKTSLAKVTDLRVWSNPNYTRVVVDVDKEVSYTYRLLKKDPVIGKPQRLYIDLGGAMMGASLKPVVPIGDELLSNARAAQHSAGSVRVVLDIKSIDKFKIFSLKNPFRVVLDVNGIAAPHARKTTLKQIPARPGEKIPKGSLAKQLALGVKRVVIDPGHGGKDPGALGCIPGVVEKNVALEVSRRLAKDVREKLGIKAVLTRDKDVFLSLEERTAMANTKNGDIFVSIHANASRNKRCRGIETYFLNLATDNDAIMVAARENATSAKNISDLEAILNDLMKNSKINESSRLAACVQGAMVSHLGRKFKHIRDNGVKQAPFYVLLGAEMPSILVEIAFISNPTECRWLNSAGYQEALANAIVAGIKDYAKEISPTAFQRVSPGLQAHN